MNKRTEGILSKNEALHLIEELRKGKIPIYGIEVTRPTQSGRETSMFKSTWFNSQRAIYKKSRDFIMKQMNGEWQGAEIKLE